MPLRGKVTTGDGILNELYEVSARYQQTGRLIRYECEPANVYASAEMWLLIETATAKLDSVQWSDSVTPARVRDALLDLAMKAIAWSREIREKC